MTAKDARFWAEQAAVPDTSLAGVVLRQWQEAIRSAAQAGSRSVSEPEVGRVRTPIPPASRKAALDQLAAAGFDVKDEAGGAVVSW